MINHINKQNRLHEGLFKERERVGGEWLGWAHVALEKRSEHLQSKVSKLSPRRSSAKSLQLIDKIMDGEITTHMDLEAFFDELA